MIRSRTVEWGRSCGGTGRHRRGATWADVGDSRGPPRARTSRRRRRSKQGRRLGAGPHDPGLVGSTGEELPHPHERPAALGWEPDGASLAFFPRGAEVVGAVDGRPPVPARGGQEEARRRPPRVDRKAVDTVRREPRAVKRHVARPSRLRARKRPRMSRWRGVPKRLREPRQTGGHVGPRTAQAGSAMHPLTRPGQLGACEGRRRSGVLPSLRWLWPRYGDCPGPSPQARAAADVLLEMLTVPRTTQQNPRCRPRAPPCSRRGARTRS
jgi:hypothetical protein